MTNGKKSKKNTKNGTRNTLFLGDCGLRINDFIVCVGSCERFMITVFFTTLLKSLLPELLYKISLFSFSLLGFSRMDEKI